MLLKSGRSPEDTSALRGETRNYRNFCIASDQKCVYASSDALSPDLSEQQQLLWRVQDGQKRLDERLKPSFLQILSEQQKSFVSGQRNLLITCDHVNLCYLLTDSHEYDHIFILQQSDSHLSHLIQSVTLGYISIIPACGNIEAIRRWSSGSF